MAAPEDRAGASMRLAARGAVAGNELRAVWLFDGEGGIGLKAAAAASFIGAHGTDDNQLVAFDEALGMNGRIAAANTDGEELGDFFGDGEKPRHRFEGAAAIISVETRDDDALAEIGELGANIHDFVAKELGFVNADDFGSRRQLFHDFRGFGDVVGGNAKAGVRDDFVSSVALIDSGLENLHALPGNFRAAQAADQLFALAGKHGADDDFNPAHIAFDDVHGRS